MILYDLVNARGAHFSPNSWRVRMALAHKGIGFEVRNVLFGTIKDISAEHKLTIPTIDHHGRLVTDSWAIVKYLDETFADTPRLIGPGSDGHVMQFFQYWVQTTLHAGIARLVMLDLYHSLNPADQAYFRASREKMYRMTLEEVQAGREERLGAFRQSLQPLRLAVGSQGFVGGAQPCYADYLAFGGFQWARLSSPFQLLAEDDAVHGWLERCLDLHGGVGRAEAPAV